MAEWAENYEDDDFHIYFDKKGLLDHLSSLEDDNLFKIHLVDEEEVNQANLVAEMVTEIDSHQLAIVEVESSIQQLSKTRDLMGEKFQTLSSHMGADYIQRNHAKFTKPQTTKPSEKLNSSLSKQKT